ncbi:MAG: alpha-D-glucose phosphate-specific phosphoglucomutase [Alphaproteobacteria bacterium]
MDIFAVPTKAYSDQKFGTSGLRKKTSVFAQENYLENAVQSVFDCLDGFEGKTLIIGGDGRYYNAHALQVIIKMAVANQFGHIIVGQNGLLSTPAVSHLIQKRGAFGAFILTASHNPGGKDGDFGLKYNISTGAPAPGSLGEAFSKRCSVIDRYWIVQAEDVDLSKQSETTLGSTLIEVIDPVADYADYMQTIFDFNAIKELFASGFKMTFNAMNAVTGPYAKYIFEGLLGAIDGTVINGTPLPDFGGRHPEPNLVYAKDLVDLAYSEEAPDLCAASDGDGDRYMILGKSFFVNPADSLAVLAEYMGKIPFYKGKFYGAARSMPTAAALDAVCKKLKKECYQTPTGWKFFGSLLENKKIALCGEESFGAGSFHVMEKDGLWAILFWLNILALTQKTPEKILTELWKKYGRIYAKTYNYHTDKADDVTHLLDSLTAKIPTLPNTLVGDFQVQNASLFNYTDAVSGEQTTNQGVIIDLSREARVFVRPSGTNSSGATLKVYLSQKSDNLQADPSIFLQPLEKSALDILNIQKYLGDKIEVAST